MSKFIDDVKAFHIATDSPIKELPAFPSDERIELRRSLVNEEAHKEFNKALDNRDLVGVADAIVDSMYVLVGTALEFGIPLDAVWDEVQRANMSKIGPDGKVKRREDGKILKPEGWKPPNIEKVLYEYKQAQINLINDELIK